MPKGRVFSLRQPEELVLWVDAYAESKGSNRNGLTRELYEALREGRLYVAPRPLLPNPFPGDEPLFPEPPTTTEE